MIISGKGVSSAGEKTIAYLTAMDLAPTFLELAGVEYPGDDSLPHYLVKA
jgi:arylsulfatase A-like enzyme